PLSPARFQHELTPLCAGVESRPAIRQYRSRRSPNQIRYTPETRSDTRSHRWSATQCIMSLDKIVIGEVQSNRSLEVLPLLTESQRESRQATHMKAGRSIQALYITGRDQVNVRESHHDPLLGRNNLWPT